MFDDIDDLLKSLGDDYGDDLDDDLPLPKKKQIKKTGSAEKIASEKAAIEQGAKELGIDPRDYALSIAMETAGTFSPTKKGPITKHGQHEGTIQYGEPQRKQYRVKPDFYDQVTRSNVQYLKDAGVKPGMKFEQIYAAINGGKANRNLDTKEPTTGRTIRDNINIARRAHGAKTLARYGWSADEVPGETAPGPAPDTGTPTKVTTGHVPSLDALQAENYSPERVAAWNAQFPNVPLTPAYTKPPRLGQIAQKETANMLLGQAQGQLPMPQNNPLLPGAATGVPQLGAGQPSTAVPGNVYPDQPPTIQGLLAQPKRDTKTMLPMPGQPAATRPRVAPPAATAAVPEQPYQKREIKPGESYYPFEKTGKLEGDQGDYLGMRDGQHYSKSPGGDIWKLNEQAGRWEPTTKTPSQLYLKGGKELTRLGKPEPDKPARYIDNEGEGYTFDPSKPEDQQLRSDKSVEDEEKFKKSKSYTEYQQFLTYAQPGSPESIEGSPESMRAFADALGALAAGPKDPYIPEMVGKDTKLPTEAPVTKPGTLAGKGGEFSVERQVGRPNEDLNTVAAWYTPNEPINSRSKEQFLAAVIPVARKYDITPEEVRRYADTAYSKGAQYFTGDGEGRVGVSFDLLADIGGKDKILAAIANEQSLDRARLDGAPAPAMLTQNELDLIDKGILNSFGPEIGSLVTGVGRSGGTALSVIGGIARPLGMEGLYEYAKDVDRVNRRLEELAGDDSWTSSVLKFAGGLPGDLSRLYLLTRIAGPAGWASGIVGFAADAGLQSSGRGESLREVGRQTAKGAIIGSIFSPLSNAVGGVAKYGVSPLVKGKVGQELVKQGFQTGAIATGTAITEQAFGATEEEAFKASVLNSLFHVAGAGWRAFRNRTVRARSWDGREMLVVIDKDGNIREPEIAPPTGGGPGSGAAKRAEDAFVEQKIQEARAQGAARPNGTALREQFRNEQAMEAKEAAKPKVKPDIEVYIPNPEGPQAQAVQETEQAPATKIPVDATGFKSVASEGSYELAHLMDDLAESPLDTPDVPPAQLDQHIKILTDKLAQVDDVISKLKSPNEVQIAQALREIVQGSLTEAQSIATASREGSDLLRQTTLETAAQAAPPTLTQARPVEGVTFNTAADLVVSDPAAKEYAVRNDKTGTIKEGLTYAEARAEADKHSRTLSAESVTYVQPMAGTKAAEEFAATEDDTDLYQAHGKVMKSEDGIPMQRVDIGGGRKVAVQQPVAKAVGALNALGLRTSSSGFHGGWKLPRWQIIVDTPPATQRRVLERVAKYAGLTVEDHPDAAGLITISLPSTLGNTERGKVSRPFNAFAKALSAGNVGLTPQAAPAAAPAALKVGDKITTTMAHEGEILEVTQDAKGQPLYIYRDESGQEKQIGPDEIRDVNGQMELPLASAPTPPAGLNPVAVSMAKRRTEEGYEVDDIAEMFGVKPEEIAAVPELPKVGNFGKLKAGMMDHFLEPSAASDLAAVAAMMLDGDPLAVEWAEEGDIKQKRAVVGAIMDAIAAQTGEEGVVRSSYMNDAEWDEAGKRLVGEVPDDVLEAMVLAAVTTSEWHKNMLEFIHDPMLEPILDSVRALGKKTYASLDRKGDERKLALRVLRLAKKYGKQRDKTITYKDEDGKKRTVTLKSGLRPDIVKRAFDRVLAGELPSDTVRRSAQRAEEAVEERRASLKGVEGPQASAPEPPEDIDDWELLPSLDDDLPDIYEQLRARRARNTKPSEDPQQALLNALPILDTKGLEQRRQADEKELEGIFAELEKIQAERIEQRQREFAEPPKMDLLTQTVLNTATQTESGTDLELSTSTDQMSLLRQVGKDMYEGDLFDTIVKEAMQNSLDAVSNAKHFGQITDPKITLHWDPETRELTMTDNGLGMDLNTVLTAYLRLGGSYKPGEANTGGKGMAKALLLYGPQSVKVSTVKDGTELNFLVTPENADPKMKIAAKERSTNKPNGTTQIFKIPETVDFDGLSKEIAVPYSSDGLERTSFFRQPLIKDVEIAVEKKKTDYDSGHFDEKQDWVYDKTTEETVLPIGKHFPVDEYEKTKAETSWGDMDIYVSKVKKDHAWNVKQVVLAEGAYQFDEEFNVDQNKRFMYDVIVNVHPNTDAASPSYPFNIRREGWQHTIQADVAALRSYIANKGKMELIQEQIDQFSNIKQLPSLEGGETQEEFDKKIKDAQELLKQNNALQQRQVAAAPTSQNIVIQAGRVSRKVSAANKLEQSFVPEVQIQDPRDMIADLGLQNSQPIYHNNTNKNWEEVAEQAGRTAAEAVAFFTEMGNAVQSIMTSVATDPDIIQILEELTDIPQNVQDFFAGISIDASGYRGVWIGTPFKGMMLNPLSIQPLAGKKGTIEAAAGSMYLTTLHEIAHLDGSGHNAHFINRLQEGLLAMMITPKGQEHVQRYTDILTRYEALWRALKQNYEQPDTTNTSKSLGTDEDAASDSGRAAGDEDVRGAYADTESGREGPGGGPSVSISPGRTGEVSKPGGIRSRLSAAFDGIVQRLDSARTKWNAINNPAGARERRQQRLSDRIDWQGNREAGYEAGFKPSVEGTTAPTDIERGYQGLSEGISPEYDPSDIEKPQMSAPAPDLEPSGFKPTDNLFNNPGLSSNTTYAWRSMGKKEFDKLAAGEQTYTGDKAATKGNFLAGIPESASQYVGKDRYLVEFGDVDIAGDEGLRPGSTADISNVTKVWKYNPKTSQWEDHPIPSVDPGRVPQDVSEIHYATLAKHGAQVAFNAEVLVERPDGQRIYIEGKPGEMPKIPSGHKVLAKYPLGRFRADKRRSGTGGLMQGAGHYAADLDEVVTYYRDLNRQGKVVTWRGVPAERGELHEIIPGDEHKDRMLRRAVHSIGFHMKQGKDFKEARTAALEELVSDREFAGYQDEDYLRTIRQEEAAIAGLRAADFKVEQPGAIYTVTLKPKDDEWLLWDRPFKDQSPKVQRALRRLQKDTERDADALGQLVFGEVSVPGSYNDQPFRRKHEANEKKGRALEFFIGNARINQPSQGGTAEEFYGDLTGDFEQTSALLRSYGIRGNKYLDSSSRYRRTAAEIEEQIKDEEFEARQWDLQAKDHEDDLSDPDITEYQTWVSQQGMEKAQDRAQQHRNNIDQLQHELTEVTDKPMTYNYVIFDDNDIKITEVQRSLSNEQFAALSAFKGSTDAALAREMAPEIIDGNLHVARQGTEIFRRLFEAAFLEEGKKYDVFAAVFLHLEQINRIGIKLQRMIDAEMNQGHGQAANALKKLQGLFQEASKTGTLIISTKMGEKFAELQRNALVEETAHRADYLARQGKPPDGTVFHGTDGYAEARAKLRSHKIYAKQTAAYIHNEIIAKIFRPDALKELNITEAQRQAIEDKYVNELRRDGVTGQAIIDAFEGVDSTYAKSFTERTRLAEAEERSLAAPRIPTQATHEFNQGPAPPGGRQSGTGPDAQDDFTQVEPLPGPDWGGGTGLETHSPSEKEVIEDFLGWQSFINNQSPLLAGDPTTYKDQFSYKGMKLSEGFSPEMTEAEKAVVREVASSAHTMATDIETAIAQSQAYATRELTKLLAQRRQVQNPALENKLTDQIAEERETLDILNALKPEDFTQDTGIQDLDMPAMSAPTPPEDLTDPPTEAEGRFSHIKALVDEAIVKHAPEFIKEGKRESGTEFMANTFRGGMLAATTGLLTNLLGNPTHAATQQLVHWLAYGAELSGRTLGGRDTQYTTTRRPGDLMAGFKAAVKHGIFGEWNVPNAESQDPERRGAIAAMRYGVSQQEAQRLDLGYEDVQAPIPEEGDESTYIAPGEQFLRNVPTAAKPAYILMRILNEAIKRTYVAVDRPFSAFGEGAEMPAQARRIAKNRQKAGESDNWKATMKELIAEPTQEMIDLSRAEGRMVTFQNPNLITEHFEGFRRDWLTKGLGSAKTPGAQKRAKVMGKAAYLGAVSIAPFMRTSSNVGIKAAEHDPILGSMIAIYQMRHIGKSALRTHDMELLEQQWENENKTLKGIRSKENGMRTKAYNKQIKELDAQLTAADTQMQTYNAQIEGGSAPADVKLKAVKANREKFAELKDRIQVEKDRLTAEKESILNDITAARELQNTEIAERRQAQRDVREKFHTAREYKEAYEAIGRVGLGAMFLIPLLSGMLAGLGIAITGNLDYDDEKEKWEAMRKAGIGEESVRVGGYWWPARMHPMTKMASIWATGKEQWERPGTGFETAGRLGGGVVWRGIGSLNPLTDPTFREEGTLSTENVGRTAMGFVPVANLGLWRQLGEVMDEKGRTTRRQGFTGPLRKQILPGLLPAIGIEGFGRESLPVAKHPLGKRGDTTRRALRLLEPSGGSFQIGNKIPKSKGK